MTHTGTLIKQEASNLIEELGLPKEKFIIINLNLPDEENLEIQEIDRLNCMCGNDENKDSLYSRVRERLQKDAILQIYDSFNNDTVFIHSDLDEIINPRYLTWFADQARKNPNILVKVPLVYLQGRADLRTYFKNTDTPAPWDDNLFLCLKSHLQHAGPTQIRSNKFTPFSKAYITQNNEIVQDAGWHFSWMGDSNTKKIKQQSFIHYTDKFDFVVGGSYNNTDLENILNTEDLENHIPPSGEKDKVLKKYNVNFLPDEIFKLDSVRNFLLPNYNNINFLENLQDILKSIYGFCSVKKATVLTNLILKHKLQLIVEIGVLEGSSFIPQALAAKQNGFGKVYAIDPWSQEESLQYTKDENHRNYWGTVNHNTFYSNFINHIEAYNIGSFVEVYKTTSKEASKNFLPYSIDLLHVDGNHSEEQSYEDVCLYLPLVRKGGFVVFDDLHWTDNGKKTTQKAARYLQQHCTEIEQVTDELGNFFVIFQKKDQTYHQSTNSKYIEINDRGFWDCNSADYHVFDKSVCEGIIQFCKKNKINTLVDFGCGTGDYVQNLIENNIQCEAYDGNPNTELLTNGLGKTLDLSYKINLNKQFDCVLSLETGEHIPKEFEQIFIDNICKHTGKHVILSWAVEGQPGTGHFNCKNNDYIIEQFLKRGFIFQKETSLKLRNFATVATWFKNTILVFQKTNKQL
jgi:predicted O-methyltransferase YrrM